MLFFMREEGRSWDRDWPTALGPAPPSWALGQESRALWKLQVVSRDGSEKLGTVTSRIDWQRCQPRVSYPLLETQGHEVGAPVSTGKALCQAW